MVVRLVNGVVAGVVVIGIDCGLVEAAGASFDDASFVVAITATASFSEEATVAAFSVAAVVAAATVMDVGSSSLV